METFKPVTIGVVDTKTGKFTLAEREAMTLAEAREVVADVYSDFCRPNFTDRHGDKPRLKAAIAAIDAHLSRAAEPVAKVGMRPRVDGYEVGPIEVEWLGTPPPPETKLYTHPPEPARDAKDARLFRALVRSFGHEYDLTKGPLHDILLRLRIHPDEEVRRPDGSFDFEASIRNVLAAECAIQDAAMAQESGDAT